MIEQVTKDSIQEAIQYKDNRLAVLVLNWVKNHSDIKLTEQQAVQLKYVRMNSLDVASLSAVMKESILAAYTIPNLLLSDAIESYVTQLDIISQEIDLYRNIITILEGSQEIFGTQDIIVNGVKVKPYIQNWINDYKLISNSEVKNALDELKYFSSTPNVRQLAEHERAVLRDIFNLYDDCQEKMEEWNSAPEPKTEQEAMAVFKDYDLYETFPELAEDLESENTTQSTSLRIQDIEGIKPQIVPDIKLPSVPARPPMDLPVNPIAIKRVVPKPPVEHVEPRVIPKVEQPTPKPPIQIQRKQATPPAKAVEQNPFQLGNHLDPKQQSKRGVVYDQDTNVDLVEVEDRAKKQEQKQKDIANKLEELKKRQKQ